MEQVKDAGTTTKTWKDYVSDWYDVYYVDYRDDLQGQLPLLEDCLEKNTINPISEMIDTWWDDPIGDYIEEIRKNMEAHGLEMEFYDHIDEIRKWIWGHDNSEPVKDLLGNTGPLAMFYSISECDCRWVEAPFVTPYMEEEPEKTAKKICSLLHIPEGSDAAKKALIVCENASYGGELRLYFASPLEDMITDNKYDDSSDKKDWQSIHFKGRFALAVYNSMEGVGDFEFVDLDVTLPFLRENLRLSKSEHYSIEQCFGTYDNWAESTDTPAMSFDKPAEKSKIKKSVINSREKRFEETFRNGGCSADDDCYTRHRDVYYVNEFPCRSVCPHCGHVWYD